MKRTMLPISAAGLALLSCVALTVSANSQTNDSVQIRATEPPPNTKLSVTPGDAIRISVTTSYVLSSADRASLSLYAEEFPESAGGCRGGVHHTNAGSQTIVTRGTGVSTMTVIWPGNGEANATKTLYPSGYVSIGANFFTADGITQIRSFGLFTNICYHFVRGAPAGGTAQNDDAVSIRSVQGRTHCVERGCDSIFAGQPFAFNLNFHYVLASADRAGLGFRVEEYPKGAGGCTGAVHQTNWGGTDVVIRRGNADGSTIVLWRGDHPVYRGGGYITFSAVYYDPLRPGESRPNVFRAFGPFSQYCYRFVDLTEGGQPID